VTGVAQHDVIGAGNRLDARVPIRGPRPVVIAVNQSDGDVYARVSVAGRDQAASVAEYRSGHDWVSGTPADARELIEVVVGEVTGVLHSAA
jgi:hypothetical protein